MATATTPGEHHLEGSTVKLSTSPEEQKGEVEGEVFQIVKFQREKPDSLSLTEFVLHVQLFCKKYGSFFKATFDDPAEVVPDHKVSMEIVISNLEEILSGLAESVHMAFDKDDGKEILLIMKSIEYKMFNTKVSFKFCYKFNKAKMSFEELNNMRLAEIHQEVKLNEMKTESRLEKSESRLEKSESRLEEIELKFREINNWLIINAKPINATFDVSKNNYSRSEDNGKTLVHNTGNATFNTTPLSLAMHRDRAYRARFHVATMKSDYMMFGVVNESFSLHNSYPQGSGHNGWAMYFYSGVKGSVYTHNGSFYGAACCAPLSGSIMTVEYYPKHGRIQYFVNNTPVGKHDGCSFSTYGYFAVTLYHTGQKVKLVSMEEISDIF